MEDKAYTGVLFDRLAGSLMTYVENYLLKQHKVKTGRLKISPSYEVDYEISDEIIRYINLTLEREDCFFWYFQIAACNDLSEVDEPLKSLVIQFLPKFFEQFPEYKNAECLKR
ncbi:MAG: hypothetical protein PUA89_10305 [Frisingicoccus sp.]|uniref:hypothetical protein n=1 Tax=Frisingicoccus sp. TaxID=1918627 RepID=UPI0026110192|nr:hypothetical protein [Frisingicoccus sp.]MDD6233089.1 hypothetical protein [Frisingicoccus sp.]